MVRSSSAPRWTSPLCTPHNSVAAEWHRRCILFRTVAIATHVGNQDRCIRADRQGYGVIRTAVYLHHLTGRERVHRDHATHGYLGRLGLLRAQQIR
uniref:Uncharacterized protein n=1 Tax=Candidatus Kentrum sp. FM TaxID=2126340 RepID=A0A450RXP9_9GAMM|nr:MAG: hypothetical protein BECKFM1743C_GA0114222_100052 [Candidatus Kentron sp. FM]VFK08789.1 MAG: hypothetical protein BECKFM1743B_GA0114221_100812 [Candidatus Kentron sp. FM]